jgi:hypothetical protein
MTADEAADVLLDRLGLSEAALGEAQAAECRRVLVAALAAEARLPTSWFEVWDRVAALEERTREQPPDRPYNLRQVYGPLNVAVYTDGVPFPRGLG